MMLLGACLLGVACGAGYIMILNEIFGRRMVRQRSWDRIVCRRLMLLMMTWISATRTMISRFVRGR